MNNKKGDGKEHNPVDIQILREMNKEIRAFLEHSLSSDAFWEKWTAINFSQKRINCWEVKNCSRKDCPSFFDTDCRCWLKPGTLCTGEEQGDFAKKYRSCFNCDVLALVEKDDLRSLYEHINILIHHLRKRDEDIVAASVTDQLTGVFNRSYFNAFMDKILAYAGRYEKQLSFIMVDLDAFKLLNDTYGHQAGDAVLVEAANLLRNNMRDSDLLFRYGGDEFLVVLSNADCERADVVEKRIKRSVNEWNQKNSKYDNFRLSLSLGCSTWNQGDDVSSTIKEADAMMYREKKLKKDTPL
jgi:diguanylate cyclase (GGDEF)-like protein